jgi:hypothetical protein
LEKILGRRFAEPSAWKPAANRQNFGAGKFCLFAKKEQI